MPQFGGKNAKKTKKTSSSSKRHFTVVMGGKEHGLYVSSTPSSAARKAVTKLCTANKSKEVEFYMREITQDSKKKTYGPYLGYIEKLKEPIELKGRVIKYKPVAKLSGKTGAKSAVKKGGMRGGKSVIPNQNFKCVNDIDPNEHTERKLRVCCDYEGKKECSSRLMDPTTHRIINNDLRYGDIQEDIKKSFLKKDIVLIKKSLNILPNDLVSKDDQEKFIEELAKKGYYISNHEFIEFIRNLADFA